MGLTAADAGAQATAARASARTDARIDGNMTGVASARKSPTGRYPDEVGPLPGRQIDRQHVADIGGVELVLHDLRLQRRGLRRLETVVVRPRGDALHGHGLVDA